jgi:DNA-binding LacI/PurR family transcriptional regulator
MSIDFSATTILRAVQMYPNCHVHLITSSLSKMATIKEIAHRSGVSIGTVSNVLNGLPTVRAESRERVLRAIDDLGYEPSLLGRALRKDKTNIIVMVVPDITNPFFPGAVRGAEDVAFQSGFRVVLCNTDNDFNKESTYLREMRSYRPSGLIIVPSNLSRGIDEARAYLKAGTAVVYMDRVPPKWSGDSVSTSHAAGAYAATTHLISLGHKRIAIISGPLTSPSGAGRLAGFERAMKKAGLPVDAAYVCKAAEYLKPIGHKLAAELLRLKRRPTAIFAANDLLAFGAMAAVREAGLSCPHDISVVGFDNLDDGDDVVPSLSTVDQFVYKIGAMAAQIVIDRDRGDKGPARQLVLPTELRVKESTAPPSAKAKR